MGAKKSKLATLLRLGVIVGAGMVSGVVTFFLALFYTVHYGTVAVPNLKGLSPEEARVMLHDLGLGMAVATEGIPSKDVPQGLIADQEPHPGFHLKAGATVAVKISLGPLSCKVPDLTGLSLTSAKVDLERAGLTVGRVCRVFAAADKVGILATDPPAGAMVEAKKAVNILLNSSVRKPSYVMPNLIGGRERRAVVWLKRHGFRLGKIHKVNYPGVPEGTVLKQYPAPGSMVTEAEVVSLWVSGSS